MHAKEKYKMRCTLKIMKSVGIYLIFFGILNLIFSWIYLQIGTDYTYWQVLLRSISNNIDTKEWTNESIFFWLTVQQFCQVICISVLTGSVLAYILNREPKLIWPEKLVIRHGRDKQKLTLGIMIGNKSKKVIHKVQCTIGFTYITEGTNPKRDGSRNLYQDIMTIENYHRFSFPLDEIPYKLLKDFLGKPTNVYDKDYINVYISGNLTGLGNPFLLCRQYQLKDIRIDDTEHVFEKDIKMPFGKTRKKVMWDEVKNSVEMGEEDRRKIVDEIKEIVQVKSVMPPPLV